MALVMHLVYGEKMLQTVKIFEHCQNIFEPSDGKSFCSVQKTLSGPKLFFDKSKNYKIAVGFLPTISE